MTNLVYEETKATREGELPLKLAEANGLDGFVDNDIVGNVIAMSAVNRTDAALVLARRTLDWFDHGVPLL